MVKKYLFYSLSVFALFPSKAFSMYQDFYNEGRAGRYIAPRQSQIPIQPVYQLVHNQGTYLGPQYQPQQPYTPQMYRSSPLQYQGGYPDPRYQTQQQQMLEWQMYQQQMYQQQIQRQQWQQHQGPYNPPSAFNTPKFDVPVSEVEKTRLNVSNYSEPYFNKILSWNKKPYQEPTNKFWGKKKTVDVTLLDPEKCIFYFGTAKRGFTSDNRDGNGMAPLSNFFKSKQRNPNSSLYVNDLTIKIKSATKGYSFDNAEAPYHLIKYLLVMEKNPNLGISIPPLFDRKDCDCDDARNAAGRDLAKKDSSGKQLKHQQQGWPLSWFDAELSEEAGPIMMNILCQKWINHPQLTHFLLNTDGKMFLEGNDWNDWRYGTKVTEWDHDGKIKKVEGENKLGKMIMKIRDVYLPLWLQTPEFIANLYGAQEYIEWVKPFEFGHSAPSNVPDLTSRIMPTTPLHIQPDQEAVKQNLKINLNDLGNSQSVNQDASRVQVTSKDDNDFTYQLQSDPFNIQAGKRLKVPYDVTVQSGEVRLGLLQTNRYGFLKDIILGQGHHTGTLDVIVPEGETTTWVEFIKQPGGQASFTVNAIDFTQEEQPAERSIKVNLNNLGNSQSVNQDASGVQVTSKDDQEYTYQLQSDPFDIQAGQRLTVPYDVTVQSGEVRLGLLQTDRYGFLKDIILGQGHHTGTLDVIVPEGETTTWVEFIKQAGKGQANFTVNAIDFTQEEPPAERSIKVNLNDLGNSQSVNQDASRVQVTSKDDQEYTYQLQSDPFNIQAGQRLTVPYDVTVERGEVRFGLLQTDRHGFLKEVILGQGQHRGTLEVIVPEGETKTWVEFIKQAGGQTTFTINAIDFLKTF